MSITLFLLGILIIEVTYLVFKSSPKIPNKLKGGLFVDTSALMDGRIVTAAQTGFVPDHLVVPRSVVNELQMLADQADPEKRSRARRGLDAITELQDMPHVRVEVIDDGRAGSGGVDERLIDLAKSHNGSICTIDFNLNKAATALGIRVLNINELAGSLRMAFLPGETISMALTQKGQSGNQAVGYLADGTMVVVDKASAMLGKTVEIEFIRSLQTAAGRMMFAKLTNADAGERKTAKTPKSSGRQPAKDAKDVQETKDNTPPVAAPHKQASKPHARNTSRRKNHEDSLMELVNKQQ